MIRNNQTGIGFENSKAVPVVDFAYESFDKPLTHGRIVEQPLIDLGWYHNGPINETDEGKELARRAELLVHILSDLSEWGVQGTRSGGRLRWHVMFWLFHPEAQFSTQREYALSIGTTKQNFGRAVSDFRTQFNHFDARLYSDDARKAARRRESAKLQARNH